MVSAWAKNAFLFLSVFDHYQVVAGTRKVQRKGRRTYLVIFHPFSFAILFASRMLTPHREVTTISKLGKWSNSPKASSVIPNWNLRNRYLKHGNTVLSNLALLFQRRIVSSLIMDVCAVDEESPLMCRETRLGRVDRQFREVLLSAMEDTSVRDVR